MYDVCGSVEGGKKPTQILLASLSKLPDSYLAVDRSKKETRKLPRKEVLIH